MRVFFFKVPSWHLIAIQPVCVHVSAAFFISTLSIRFNLYFTIEPLCVISLLFRCAGESTSTTNGNAFNRRTSFNFFSLLKTILCSCAEVAEAAAVGWPTDKCCECAAQTKSSICSLSVRTFSLCVCIAHLGLLLLRCPMPPISYSLAVCFTALLFLTSLLCWIMRHGWLQFRIVPLTFAIDHFIILITIIIQINVHLIERNKRGTREKKFNVYLALCFCFLTCFHWLLLLRLTLSFEKMLFFLFVKNFWIIIFYFYILIVLDV